MVVLVFGFTRAVASLTDYDAAINDDAASGLVPSAKLTSAVTFNGATYYPFDFGPISGSAAMEFIVEGSPVGVDGYLAVGSNTSSNLRFEQYNNTGQMGFTQLAVADYLFTPAIPTPAQARHVVYVWNGAGTMQLYVDGALAGTRTGVTGVFGLPTGLGRLGANPSGTEAMTGTIHRVTTYDNPPSAAAIQRHAEAFLGIVKPPAILVFKPTPAFIPSGAASQLSWQVTGAGSITLDGVPVAASGSQNVSPAANTIYTLAATNAAATVSSTADVKIIHPAAHLVISEFVAESKSTLADDDAEFSDWIEIHNPAASTVSLAGWFLTDEEDKPHKWAFPAANLAADGYVIVFASGKDRKPPAGPWHTNFKLSKEGEYLALVGPTGVVQAFSPTFPPQDEDVSFGLIGDDPALAYPLGHPTAGTVNDITPPKPKPVAFSAPNGLFNGTLNVTLSTPTPGAQILYTINGAIPTAANGTVYSAPLALSTTTRLRAIAVANGQLSAVTGAHYIRLGADLAGYTSPLPLLLIENFGQGVIPQKGWNTNGSGIQQVPRQAAYWATYDRQGAAATFGGAPQMQGRIGIRGRGAYSTTWAQKPYSVESMDETDAETEVAPLGLPEHADWVLYYPDPGDNKDQTLLFNTFAYALSNACGRYAPRFRFVEAFVHETGGDLTLASRRGVYVLLEKVSRGKDRLNFDKLSADGTTGTWLLNINRMDAIPETGWPAANGATQPQFFHTRGPDGIAQSPPNGQVVGDDLPHQSNGYLNFDNPSGYEITATQRTAIENWFQQFETVLYNNAQWQNPVTGYRAWLDPKDFAEFFVFNTLTHNGDGLLISMFPWKGSDGRLRMGPVWDFNYAAYYASGVTTGDLLWRSNQLWYTRLFTDPDFNQLFIDRWFAFRRGAMSNASMAAIIDAQAAEITDAKAVQQGLASAATWQGRLSQMKTWLQTRANWIDSQYTAPPQFSLPGGNVAANSSLSITAPAGTICYTLDGSDPRAAGGGIAPNAMTTLPITINGAVRVFARAKNGTAWSAPTSASYVAGADPANVANLAITEIQYHPAGESGLANPDDLEFVELQNFGAQPVSLLGVRFARVLSAGIDFDFSNGSVLVLAPGARVLVVKNRAAFEAHYGTGLPIAGEFEGNLANPGDTLTLLDAAGATLRSFAYADIAPWPTGADGDGYSLVLAAPSADPTVPANWRTSVAAGGSPGGSDSVPFAGTTLGYAFGTEIPALHFDRASRLLSCTCRPGADAVILVPERSNDLQSWQSGAAWFDFAGETRAADGTMVLRWLLKSPPNEPSVCLRVKALPR
jgi:hypothetical protein